MFRPRVLFVCVVSVLVASAFAPRAAAAGPVLLGVTLDTNELIQINTTTGAGTLIGTLDSNMEAFDLAVSGGKLFTYDQTADLLRQLDPHTGHTLASVDLGLGNLTGEGGLAFNSSGQGFLADSRGASSNIFSATTGANSGADFASEGTTGIDGFAFNSTGGLFALGQQNGDIYNVNQTTHALTLIGGGHSTLFDTGGLTFMPGDDSRLFASIEDTLYAVDPTTGVETKIGNGIGFAGVSGLAFVDESPIPEPGTLLLLGSGVALLARRRRKTTVSITL